MYNLDQVASAEDPKPGRKAGACFDCGCGWEALQGYMVRDHLWEEAWPNYGATERLVRWLYRDPSCHALSWLLLCLPCLSARLGRKLTLDDFDFTIPLNHHKTLRAFLLAEGMDPIAYQAKIAQGLRDFRQKVHRHPNKDWDAKKKMSKRLSGVPGNPRSSYG